MHMINMINHMKIRKFHHHASAREPGFPTVFNKTGLGYKSQKKQKFFKNFFVLASTTITCFCYEKSRHKAYNCLHRKSNILKKIWIPKETIVTNPKGSKMTWVPKLKT